MRALGLGVVALLCAGCITVSPATPRASQLVATAAPPTATAPLTVTPAPTSTPVATTDPTAAPTAEVTPDLTPAVTPDPNITPDPNATPEPTPLDLLPFLSAEVTVVNLADIPLTVTVTLVDAETEGEFALGATDVQPLQVTSQAIAPARFRIEFDYAGGSAADAGTCLIDIAEEEIQFAVIEGGAVITAGVEPEDPADLVVATATRCRAGEA